jgi:primary-amine oxidase
VAIFTPTNSTVTDPTAFIGSQSPAVAYTITAATSTTPTLLGPDGSTLSSDPTLTMGETITVQASGFTAGESVSAVVHSTPETLTPATASSTGTISYAFTVPSDLLTGAHTLVLTGATSQTTVTVDFSIASPAVLGTTTTSTTTPSAGSASLPFTGSDIELLAAIGIACTGVGLAMRTRKGTPRYVAGHEWRRRH